MDNIGVTKFNNIMDMLKELNLLYKNMPDSNLKRDYHKLLQMITSGVDLKKIILRLSHHIDDAKSATKGSNNPSSDNILSFWGKVKEIIMDTYTKNQELKG